MAQDNHKDRATFVAAFPTLMKLDNTNTLDSLASRLAWTRDKTQEVSRELAIR